MKQRLATIAVAPLALLLLTSGSATGQDVGVDQGPDPVAQPASLRVLVTATEGQPPSEWDAETLVRRIIEGSVRVDEVTDDPMDAVFPTRDIVVARRDIEEGDAIEPEWLDTRSVPIDETNATAFTDPADVVGWITAVDIYEYQPITPNLLWAEVAEPAADAPSPVEIVDYGMTAKGGDVNYAAVVRNPNQSRWSASLMPVRIDVLDKNGDVIATEGEFVTLLPGQTGAIVGDISGAKGAAAIEIALANGINDWAEYGWMTGGLDTSNVKTKWRRSGPQTTGRIESLFDDWQEGIQVMAVYRDKAGGVLGGDYTYVRILPGSGTTLFEIEGSDLIPRRRIDHTEVYYEY